MRPAAEIDERRAVAIGGDRRRARRCFRRELRLGGPVCCRHRLDDLFFERLVGEDLETLSDVVLFADEGLSLGDDRAHLGLDHRQVLVGEVPAVGQLEVVVEAVRDRGSDRKVRARKQAKDRLRHHVRSRVADHRAPLVGVPRHHLHAIAVVERLSQIDERPVHLRRDGVFGESRADRGGEVGDGRAGVEFALCPIRDGDGDRRHEVGSLLWTMRCTMLRPAGANAAYLSFSQLIVVRSCGTRA